MANKIIQLKDGNDNLYPAPPCDYIVEQGTSGIWTYRKWASGIAECWGTANVSNTTASSWVNGIYFHEVGTINYPSNLFIEPPKAINIDEADAQLGWHCGIKSNTKDAIQPYRADGGSETGGTKILFIQAKGLWKALEQVGGGNT